MSIYAYGVYYCLGWAGGYTLYMYFTIIIYIYTVAQGAYFIGFFHS